jgi:hypothetical protein
MPPLATSLLDAATCVARHCSGVEGGTAEGFAALDTEALTAATRAIADLRRTVDQFAALAAGEIAHRSRRELGHQGLAQGAGFVSPVAMIQSLTQVGKAEAARQVETGTLLVEVETSARIRAAVESGDIPAADVPTAMTGALAPQWQTLLASGVLDGRLSLDKVDAIRRVMAEISDFDDATISTAVGDLIDAAPGLNPEQLCRAARHARDLIDQGGIEAREKRQRDQRSVRTWWDANGMFCGSWRLPPEDGTLVAEAFEQILSPRRGGPRFVDPEARRTAEDLIDDVRSDEQITADAFTDMVRLATDADPGTLFGSRRPAVRVIVTAERLEHTSSDGQPDGFGHLEARHDALSMPAIDRHLCNTGLLSIAFDTDGRCVNVGRDQRLFTERQRIGMAVRDGGCRFPGCDRPPSYCEAHHIDPWHASHGRTDIDDGILLCRRHHLLIHNNAWLVTRQGADYSLVPPRDIDPLQMLIPMPSRSPVDRDIRSRLDKRLTPQRQAG